MNKQILIVEDDPLVAIMLEGYLDALGYTVVTAVETVAAALACIAKGGFDCAIVDVHLADGEISSDAVAALQRAQIPFFVTTGGQTDLEAAFRGAPLLLKPFTLATLERALADLGPLPREKDMC